MEKEIKEQLGEEDQEDVEEPEVLIQEAEEEIHNPLIDFKESVLVQREGVWKIVVSSNTKTFEELIGSIEWLQKEILNSNETKKKSGESYVG